MIKYIDPETFNLHIDEINSVQTTKHEDTETGEVFYTTDFSCRDIYNGTISVKYKKFSDAAECLNNIYDNGNIDFSIMPNIDLYILRPDIMSIDEIINDMMENEDGFDGCDLEDFEDLDGLSEDELRDLYGDFGISPS